MNPLITNKRHLFTFVATWLIIALVHFGFLNYFLRLPTFNSAIDSLIFNLSFALISFSIWYIIKFVANYRKYVFNLLIHTYFCIILVYMWTKLGNNISLNYFDTQIDQSFIKINTNIRYILGAIYYSLFTLMFYNFKYYEDLQQNIRKEHELKSQLKESEFEALKAQINPHFLFNSLNSISSLCMIDSAKAQSMIINLSDFLRLSINKKNEHTTSLEEEIENMNLYLGIEKQRFGKKLNVVYHLKENTTKAIIPSMILQPIIENSIKHGVSQLTDLSDIVIRSSIKAQNLQISIENQFDPSYSAKKGTGIGIKNIRNRLVNLYDKVDLLEIEKQENKFIVKLTIPQETQNI